MLNMCVKKKKFRPRNISTKELNDTGRADAISKAQLDMT